VVPFAGGPYAEIDCHQRVARPSESLDLGEIAHGTFCAWPPLDLLNDRPAPGTLAASSASLISLILLAVVLAIVLTTTIRSPLKDDVAWLLHVAREVFDGKRLYVDDIEINPPLIVWLLMVPVELSAWTGASAEALTVILSAGVITLCALWSSFLLRGYAPLFESRAPVFAATAAILLLAPGVEFGQREHLLSACALPYICVLARRLRQQRPSAIQALCCGLVAAIGCALKPDYVLAFMAAEAFAALRGLRPWRIEAVSMALLLLCYAVMVWFFYPAYFSVIVPMIRDLYGASDVPLGRLLLQTHTLLLGAAVVLLLCFAKAGRTRDDPLFTTLAAFGVGASLAYFIEAKDWFYHRLPATIVFVLALAYWIAGAMMGRMYPGRRRFAALVMSACALGAFAGAAADRLAPRLEIALQDRTALENRVEALIERNHVDRYLAFSQSLSLGFPVINETGALWASRFDSMWALRGVLWRRRTGRPASAWPVMRWIVADFIHACPDMVVVDDRDGLDYIRVLSASPQFAAAWSNYRQTSAFDGIRVFARRVGNGWAMGNTGTSDPPRAMTDRVSLAPAFSPCLKARE
jgi:hypothetical protein